MQELEVELGSRSYPIYIGEDTLVSKDLFNSLITSSQVMVVTNTIIEPLYLQHTLNSLSDFDTNHCVLPDGELHKTLDVMNNIITSLLEKKYSRDCCLVALGGGVVGDITGFAAACYQRGVKYIQIPTTLLAQVDSSVGGKTAVNHESGKNMIGAFHQPQGVIIDTNLLKTLPDRELSAGLAEVIKYGLIRDINFFVWLEENMDNLVARDSKTIEYAIAQSCINKAEIVSADERESGIRAILNYGHTFGHAIETGLNYKDWLHGEAVSVGMLMAAEMSVKQGWLKYQEVSRIREILIRARLPVELPESMKNVDMRELMSVDKKARSGKLYLVLLKQIGESLLTADFDEQLLAQTLSGFPYSTEVE